MNTYLAIMVTVLVATQIVRVTQNHIQLHRQQKEFDKTLGWIKDNDIREVDFQTQREVFQMLHKWLSEKEKRTFKNGLTGVNNG